MDLTAFVQAVLLGLVEGLTEFIPVSSTGHLVVASEILGFHGEGSVAFKIAIQLGSILAVLGAYRERFWQVAGRLVHGDRAAIAFTRNILLGFGPALVVGAIAYPHIRALLDSPMTVAIALIVGGLVILLIESLVRDKPEVTVERIPARTALAVGIAQCVAMIPGVSRSGATIMGGLGAGLDRKTATEFSFFLALPTMAAATAYTLYKEHAALNLDDFGLIAVGFIVAFLSSLVVVRWLVRFISHHSFAVFAWYRIALGTIVLVWLLSR